MNKESIYQIIIVFVNKTKKKICFIAKDKVHLFAQVILLILYLIFIFLYGIKLINFCLYIIFSILSICVFLLLKNNKFYNQWMIALIALFIPVLNLTKNEAPKVTEILSSQSETEVRETEPQVDTLFYYHEIEEKIELPDGTKYFKTSTVGSEIIRTAIQESSNPIEIHYTIGELSSNDIKNKPEKTLNELNKIITQFENDSIHFSLDRNYVSKKWEYLIRGFDCIYIVEPDLFIRYNYEYLYLISFAYFNRGVILDRMGHPDKALLDYDEAIKINPSILLRSTKLDINKALAYLHLEDYEKAVSIINKSIDQHPSKSAELNFYKGYVYLLLKDYKKAIIYFEKATETDRIFRKADAYNYLGVSFYGAGNAKKAIWAFSNAIQSFNSDSRYLEYTLLYYYNRSLVYRSMGLNKLADNDKKVIQKYEDEAATKRHRIVDGWMELEIDGHDWSW